MGWSCRKNGRYKTGKDSICPENGGEMEARKTDVAMGDCGERWSRGRAPDCQSRGRWFNPTYRRFESYAISSPHICLCLSEETLKAGGPFCLVSMPGEVKDPTQGVNV